MRIAWVHPSWRDLVIDHVSHDTELRRQFLHECSIHGALLALSAGGGHTGRRRLPLLIDDGDWDALTDALHRLVADLEHIELVSLLDRVRDTLDEVAWRPAYPEAAALAHTLLKRVAALWARSPAAIPVAELAAWFGVARVLSPQPPTPNVASTWAELLPVSTPDLSDHRAIERLADWLALASQLSEYDPETLHALGFPGQTEDLLITFFVHATAQPVDQSPRAVEATAGALEHLPRLFPVLADASTVTRYRHDHVPPRESDPVPWSSEEGHGSGVTDVQRVLADL